MMKRSRIFSMRAKFFLVFNLVLFLSACKNPEKDYHNAKEQNTIESYSEFIKKYPDHILIIESKKEIERLKFEEIVQHDSIELYNDFLLEYPAGPYSDSVKVLISRKKYYSLLENLNIENFMSFIKQNPESEFIDSAKMKLLANDYYEGIEIKGELMNYKDLCYFDNKILHLHCSQTIGGRFVTNGCNDMIKKYGHPPVLKLSIINKSGKTKNIKLNGFNSLKINTKDNKTQKPKAFGFSSPNPFGGGSSFGFTVIEEGGITYEVSNNDYIDLAFICPSISKGDILIFNNKLVATIK